MVSNTQQQAERNNKKWDVQTILATDGEIVRTEAANAPGGPRPFWWAFHKILQDGGYAAKDEKKSLKAVQAR